MKIARNVSLFALVICYHQEIAMTAPLTHSQREKIVNVSIRDVRSIFSGSATTSYAAGPNSKATTTIYWNGYGFFCKQDSGETFWRYSNDLAFKKSQMAQFIIIKKVTLIEKSGSNSVSTSQTVVVKRGVPATF